MEPLMMSVFKAGVEHRVPMDAKWNAVLKALWPEPIQKVVRLAVCPGPNWGFRAEMFLGSIPPRNPSRMVIKEVLADFKFADPQRECVDFPRRDDLVSGLFQQGIGGIGLHRILDVSSTPDRRRLIPLLFRAVGMWEHPDYPELCIRTVTRFDSQVEGR